MVEAIKPVYELFNSKEESFAYFNQYTKEQIINYTIELEKVLASTVTYLDKANKIIEALTNGKNKESKDGQDQKSKET